MAAAFHPYGLNHRDLYICHLLIRRPRGGIEYSLPLFLIDLHRMQRRRVVPRRWQAILATGELARYRPLDARVRNWHTQGWSRFREQRHVVMLAVAELVSQPHWRLLFHNALRAAFRHVFRQPGVSIMIFGTSNPDHLCADAAMLERALADPG